MAYGHPDMFRLLWQDHLQKSDLLAAKDLTYWSLLTWGDGVCDVLRDLASALLCRLILDHILCPILYDNQMHNLDLLGGGIGD